MTVIAKNINYGLDKRVKQIQDQLDVKLAGYWSGNIDIYGLVFRNERDSGVVPEFWTGDGIKGREYKEVYHNDSKTATICFIEQLGTRVVSKAEGDIGAEVDIVFIVDLEKAYDANIRDNERAYIEAQRSIELSGATMITDFKQTISNVFSGFVVDKIKYRDMQPWVVFSFTVRLNYSKDLCQ